MSTRTFVAAVAVTLVVGCSTTAYSSGNGVPIIRTIAGGGSADPGDDGPALDAQLADPGGLARDAAGNLYIADTSHHRIRKLTASTGIITTIAGTGVAGYNGDGGLATASLLNAPNGVAVDGAGNVYIADTMNHCVRKVWATSGVIERLAGIPGVAGYNPLTLPLYATENPLDHPTGVAVDARGVVYVADRDNHRIRTVSGGIMSTFAGNSLIPDRPPFKAPCPIVNQFIWVHLAPIGGYSGDGGPPSLAELRCPSGVTLDAAGNVYIADTSNDAIRKVTASTSIISTLAGGHWYTNYRAMWAWFDCSLAGDSGPATDANLCHPTGVATDTGGNVYIADSDNHRIRKVAARTGVITTVAGSGINSTGPYPVGQQGFSGDGGAPTAALLNGPSGLAVDPTGTVYLVDSGNQRIRSIVFGDVPISADLDGDGRSDLVVWRPSNGTWYWLTSSSGYAYTQASARQWGDADLGDVPLAGDIDGDGKGDLIVWRASTGTWYWLTSSTGYDRSRGGARQWGNEGLGDIPLLGDLDGDGKSDLMVWRASTGTWFWLTSSSGYDPTRLGVYQWGNATLGDVPIVGDIDGDGKGDLIVWRASTGMWYWLRSASGYDPRSADSRQWGNQSQGDMPFLRDIDGDGKSDLIIWRASTGTWYWLTSTSANNPAAAQAVQWGAVALGDSPLLSDCDTDGRADLMVWRASSGTWYWVTSSTGYQYVAAAGKQWGSSN